MNGVHMPRDTVVVDLAMVRLARMWYIWYRLPLYPTHARGIVEYLYLQDQFTKKQLHRIILIFSRCLGEPVRIKV